jgi:hypothetical protein
MSFSYRLRVRANSGLTTDQDSVQLTIPGLQKPVEVKAAKGTLSAPVWLVYCACGRNIFHYVCH